jgi:hypothetical protein
MLNGGHSVSESDTGAEVRIVACAKHFQIQHRLGCVEIKVEQGLMQHVEQWA